MQNICVVEYGSNIEPELNVPKAVALISDSHIILKKSALLITKPVEHEENADFNNGALLIKTNLCKEDFNNFLKKVEIKTGRVKTADKYAPRTIDLDIIVWNGKIIDNDFYDRDFVKKSVLEVLPDLVYNR